MLEPTHTSIPSGGPCGLTAASRRARGVQGTDHQLWTASSTQPPSQGIYQGTA